MAGLSTVGIGVAAKADGEVYRSPGIPILMIRFLKFAAVVTAVCALAQSLLANTIDGAIGFSGRVAFDTTSAGDATAVVGWYDTTVNGATGSFASIANNAAAAFTTSTWYFNDSTTINNFWVVGGFTFDLLSSTIISQYYGAHSQGFLNVSGSGKVSNDGGATWTDITWYFSSRDPSSNSDPGEWNFSVSQISQSVPDGGTTVILLGLGLSAVALLRKKLAS